MEKTVLFFGDSNTYGANPVTGGRYPRTERFTGLVQEALGTQWHVVEEGMSGRTTVFEDPVDEGVCGLSHLCTCLRSHAPLDKLVVMLGTNDSKERFAANAKVIARGMERLIKRAMQIPCWADKPDILVVAPVPMAEHYLQCEASSSMGPGCREKTLALAAEYEALCKELHVDFMDAGAFVAAPHPIDGVHLSKEGHRALAQAFAAYLKERS